MRTSTTAKSKTSTETFWAAGNAIQSGATELAIGYRSDDDRVSAEVNAVAGLDSRCLQVSKRASSRRVALAHRPPGQASRRSSAGQGFALPRSMSVCAKTVMGRGVCIGR